MLYEVITRFPPLFGAFAGRDSTPSQGRITSYNVCYTKLLRRENIGYDFMSYKVGLLESGININTYESVLICNDSVYGPLFDLQVIIERMNKLSCDFWGMTRSLEGPPHLQSYFIYFNKPVLQSGHLVAFFTQVCIEQSKKDIIQKYEIGLTQYLCREGYKYAWVATLPSLKEKVRLFCMKMNNVKFRGSNVKLPIALIRFLIRYLRNFIAFFNTIILKGTINPSQYYWRHNLQTGFPFVKIELLRKNPFKLEDYEVILGEIELKSEYPIRYIRKHLDRTRSKY